MICNYVIWKSKADERACRLSTITNFDEGWKLLRGVPVSGEFPANVQFAMNADFPRSTMLTDNLQNINMQIVGSQRLCDLIESHQPAALEYLRVDVVNHKKRAISEPYFIIHPIEPVDCLVISKCNPEWRIIGKDQIDDVGKFVIDEQLIPADRLLFRPRQFYRNILVHRRLAKAIDAAGMTGIRWLELRKYPES